MKKVLKPAIALVLFILVLPALTFFKQGGKQPSADVTFKPTVEAPPQAVLDEEDYQKDNFYLMLDVNTDKVLKISPIEYIKGVVAGEMPISYSTEALKAQAVAAHTYTLFQIGISLENPSDELKGAYLSNNPSEFQAYISTADRQKAWGSSFNANEDKLTGIVSAVINEVMTYQDAPIAAAFHAISSGKTEKSSAVWSQELPYLSPVISSGDSLSPDYMVESVLKETEIVNAVKSAYPDVKFNKNREKWFEILERSDSGNITKIKAGTKTITGTELRKLLRLRSANFTVEHKGDSFIFTTKGYGHGVGMSQYGADFMARQGKSYKEILLHYYNDIEITQVDKL